MPSVESPLVNEYKVNFIKKRLLETFFGGPKTRFGQKVPWHVYVIQLGLYLLPIVVGGVFLGLTESNVLTVWHGMIGVGVIMFILTVLVQLVSWRIQKKTTAIAPLKSKLVDHIMEDEPSIENTNCCNPEVAQFIVPLKRYKINVVFHAAISGLMCAGAFHYLQPFLLKTLMKQNEVAAYIVLGFGWIVVCVAQYSLTTNSPPEPVVYHALDNFEITSLMRPFYVLVFISVNIIIWYHPPSKHLLCIDRCIHVLFTFLPILWFMGLLPPLDALFPWLGEQILIYIFGGSSMASDVRLGLMLLISGLEVIVLCFIPSTLVIILASVGGYVLSLDLFKFGNFMLKIISGNGQCMHKINVQQSSKTCVIMGWTYYLVIFLLLVTIIVSPQFGNENTDNDECICNVIMYLLIIIVAMNMLGSSWQRVYLFFSWFINPCYPSSSMQINRLSRKMKRFAYVGYLRLYIFYFGTPLLTASYLYLLSRNAPLIRDDAQFRFIDIIAIARAYRWIWQQTDNAMLEFSIIVLINKFSKPIWNLGFPLQLLVAAFLHNRVIQLINKLHFAFILLVSSLTLKKQRCSHSYLIAGLNILFLPIVVLIIALSCIISAPLLPLFTLPIFLIGFPRPLRIWPGQVKKSISSSGDAVYYMQLAHSLASKFHQCQIMGRLGNANVGDHFLVRFEDRVAIVLILEKGFGYSTFGIKGLELQETSCHAVEATHLDSYISSAFDKDSDNSNSVRCVNPDPFHVFQPLTMVLMVTYSDTRNVLTGLIDSPDTLKLIASSFVKSLIWILFHHCAKVYTNKNKEESENKLNEEISTDDVMPLSAPKRPKSADSMRKLPKAKKLEECIVEISRFSAKPSNNQLELERLPEAQQSQTSVTNSWSDDDDDPLGDSSTPHPPKKLNSVTSRPGTTLVCITHIPGTIGDTAIQNVDFGLPAMDINLTEKGDSAHRLTVIKNPISYSSSAEKFAPLDQWTELPFDSSELTTFRQLFPLKWYIFVLRLAATKHFQVDGTTLHELETDKTLLRVYQELVLTCYVIVNQLIYRNDNQMHLRPGHVYKTFIGDIPWSSFQEWLVKKEELNSLVIKAYGYATKFALDQMLLGESTSDEEIADYFVEYDESWYIGSDTNKAWEENVLAGKPNMFSLGYNPVQRTFTSHLLTLQELPVYIGKLNPEAVRSLWASLAFELLYLTNDDEERYSIQAHPYIFRNLIIQAADSPLGYPIFSSEPLTRDLGNI